MEILNVFNTLILKKVFCKKKTFFRKLDFRFLVESTKIEIAIFSYKTVLPEANVKRSKLELEIVAIKKNGELSVTSASV